MEEKPQPLTNGGGGGGKGPTRQTALDLMDPEHKKSHMIPVWFFVGVILLIYGLLIFSSGVYELSRPPSTVLANLHPAIWWGGLLAMLGAIYLYLFMPGKS